MPNLSRSEAEDILYREARLLDDRCYREWLELFGEDARYWIPCNGEGTDPEREITLVYDDLPRLRDRVERLASGVAHAQTPPSRTKRLISNVEVDNSLKMPQRCRRALSCMSCDAAGSACSLVDMNIRFAESRGTGKSQPKRSC